ncbi:MAG: cytochrome C biogenesis protein [Bacteroidetes bacterium GWF2_38_335]|nr:MAG: cytochrome C biogenesis protein [Bacteroidetes bacterium GWF2_38_335]OFY80819.1 MAG: cytochrome C biogenesis protein [Bacteroidetes bacterium RIFOXYA12_FULL_38_20]HBS86220.1 cytochrome C biogenesis protein [Bacteroidales bacterium]
MEYLQSLLENSDFPLLSALILGLMTAISPCPLATNITAIAFISKDMENKKKVFINGLIYTLGRTISYTALGVVLFFGASKFHVASFFQTHGEQLLGPILIVIGIFMLGVIKINFPGLGNLTSRFEKKGSSSWGALILGILFALAFCPYSGVLYFGILIPMTISSSSGLLLPPVFAIATGIPVIIIAYLLAFTLSGVGGFYKKMKTFEKWFRLFVGIVFILVGLYYMYIFYF